MSEARKRRLAKLVKLQGQIKALHETRHAGHLAAAADAEREAHDLVARFDDKESLSGLFPDLYHRRIAGAQAQQQASRQSAGEEAARVATATLRANMVEEAYREAARGAERSSSDRERLEIVERGLNPRK